MPDLPEHMPPSLLSMAAVRWHAVRVFRFGIVSGVGLAIDLALFLTLIHAHASVFAANVLSSATALTFVYCASVRRVFRYEGRFIAPLFGVYVLYHLCGTLLVSLGISELVHVGLAPFLAKVGILPATFSANYLFMSWVTTRREWWIRRMGATGGRTGLNRSQRQS